MHSLWLDRYVVYSFCLKIWSKCAGATTEPIPEQFQSDGRHGSPQMGKKWRRADTNVVAIKFDQLKKPSSMHTGDPVSCQRCHAMMSHLSRVEDCGDEQVGCFVTRELSQVAGTPLSCLWHCICIWLLIVLLLYEWLDRSLYKFVACVGGQGWFCLAEKFLLAQHSLAMIRILFYCIGALDITGKHMQELATNAFVVFWFLKVWVGQTVTVSF